MFKFSGVKKVRFDQEVFFVFSFHVCVFKKG